ncbi:MAG: CvpA family protein [bacterium]
MNYLDLIIILVVGFFAIKGLFRGFFQEFLGLVGLVVALIFATKYMSNAAVWINKFFDLPPGLVTLVGFLLIFFGIVFGFQLLSHFLQQVTRHSFLGGFEKLAGGVVGFLKGATIISLLILFIFMIPFAKNLIPGQAESKFFYPAKNFAPKMFDLLKEFIPGSKSFYSELKESLENFSTKELGNNAQKFLNSLQNDDHSSDSNSTDDQSH